MSKLLKLIAAVPPGEKLPLSRLARELSASASVVTSLVEGLVRDGKLDRVTLRPPLDDGAVLEIASEAIAATAEIAKATLEPDPGVELPPPAVRAKTSGDVLIERVKAAAAERGIALTTASTQIFGHKNQIGAIVGREVREATRRKVESWLSPAFARFAAVRAETPRSAFLEILAGEASRVEISQAALCRKIFGSDTRLDHFRRTRLEPIGIQTVREVHAFLAALSWSAQVDGLAELAAIVASATALEGGEGGEDPPAALEHAAPADPPRLPRTSFRNVCAEDVRSTIEIRRELTDRAHETRQPGETVADRFRRLAAEVDAEEADGGEDDGDLRDRRRAQALADVPTPSDLIRRAQKDWPDQAAKVAAIAAELGVGRGEAWRRVIVAGLKALSEGGE